MYFTVQPYSDPSAGTIDSSYTDTIALSQVNSPQNGMLLGNVTRTGSGAGSGKIACAANKGSELVLSCAGQSQQ